MQFFEVPLTPVSQQFAITLGGIRLTLTVTWRNLGGAGWVLDIEDGTTGLALVHGIPLVTGIDLLAQYKHLGIPGGLIVTTDSDTDVVPTSGNLGVSSHLLWTDLAP